MAIQRRGLLDAPSIKEMVHQRPDLKRLATELHNLSIEQEDPTQQLQEALALAQTVQDAGYRQMMQEAATLLGVSTTEPHPGDWKAIAARSADFEFDDHYGSAVLPTPLLPAPHKVPVDPKRTAESVRDGLQELVHPGPFARLARKFLPELAVRHRHELLAPLSPAEFKKALDALTPEERKALDFRVGIKGEQFHGYDRDVGGAWYGLKLDKGYVRSTFAPPAAEPPNARVGHHLADEVIGNHVLVPTFAYGVQAGAMWLGFKLGAGFGSLAGPVGTVIGGVAGALGGEATVVLSMLVPLAISKGR